MDDPAFPKWLDKRLVDDRLFAHAYEITGDVGRSRIKSLISLLYKIYPPGPDALETRTGFNDGARISVKTSPCETALIWLGRDMFSPARVLAAVMPALTTAGQVLVASDREEWPGDILTALELAGQEWAASMPLDEVANLAAYLAGKKSVVLSVGSKAENMLIAGQCSEHGIPFKGLDGHLKAGLINSPDNAWDFDCLRFAQAGVQASTPAGTVDVFGDDPGPGFDHAGEENEFPAEKYQVVYSAEMPDPDLGCELIIPPGREYFWLWPGLDREFFKQSLIAVS